MITNNYNRMYEGDRGLVSIKVSESDISGVSVEVLVRYADDRPDKAAFYQPPGDFITVLAQVDQLFQNEVKAL